MATVFLDGRFVAQAEARVSAFDAGLQHGVGLFETMLGGAGETGAGWVFRLEEHLERLAGSTRELGLSEDVHPAGLAQAVLKVAAESGLERARLRLTLTGGDLNLLGKGAAGAKVRPTIMIVAQPATQYPPELFERGASVVIADLRINPLDPTAGHKTINYWARLRELQQAAAKGAGEALVFQVTNHLAGGCVSNAFVVKAGEIVTPIARGEEGDHGKGATLPSPVLPGITRGWLLEWAARERIAVRRRMLTIHDVLSADEAFLTNSSWGVMPVVKAEKEPIGGGTPGELTRSAREGWAAAVDATG
jgi:branched-subunit amino acid aminotransferase/4-amino-4-deoxychorismate lyase